jgi:hypothetical protein
MAGITEFAWACRDARRFRNLPEERRRIVFYSEGRSYTKYLTSVAACLLRNHGATLAYLTSDPTDPVLALENPRIDAFYIGVGSVRTLVFQRLRARVLVMTMPDLATFHIKRSSVHSVHYVYLHHSMVSTHMVYRRGLSIISTVSCAPALITWMRYERGKGSEGCPRNSCSSTATRPLIY